MPSSGRTISIHFSDHFRVDPASVREHGAFDISVIRDLPLFVDPFLLFNSQNEIYRELHDGIIEYLRFLKDKAIVGGLGRGLVDAWFRFPEVRQNWLGYSKTGNAGRGLGAGFAENLARNLETVFKSFGDEDVTRGSHLEKLVLIDSGVGCDSISDFTTNLIKGYLVDFTEEFTLKHIDTSDSSEFRVDRVAFNYETETWSSRVAILPQHGRDYVLLTPRDILTRDKAWINRPDLVAGLGAVIDAVPNEQLRSQLNNYLMRVLPDEPTRTERDAAATQLIRRYPLVLEHYIRLKEDGGDDAFEQASLRVENAEVTLVEHVRSLAALLLKESPFYGISGNTYREARQRALFLKDVVENKGGHRLFYRGGERTVRREEDLQIMYRLTWFGSAADVTREANDGRGPADFKVSVGASDKSIVEFKLASNPRLRQNLANQVDVYKKASDAEHGLHVIFYFDQGELERLNKILRELGLLGAESVILIDARYDNKPSGSRA